MDDTAANPDQPCPHADFDAVVTVGRIGEGDIGSMGQPTGYLAEVTVACKACSEPFRFVGLTAGLSFAEPRVSVDGKTLMAPIRPASADPDFGLGLPGFWVKATSP